MCIWRQTKNNEKGKHMTETKVGFDFTFATDTEAESGLFGATEEPVEHTDEEEYDAETLWSAELDHQADEAAIKESLPPAGNYTTVPELSAKRFINFYGGTPRRILSFAGKITNKQATTTIRFKISPDKGFNKDGTKLSWDFILYNQAKTAYERVHGVKPATIDDLEVFLRDTPVTLRVYQQTTDLGVAEIKPARRS
jgi:hypothetical protein